MKWIRRKHKEGTTKYKICFAWWPVHTDDNKTIWLERYMIKLEYSHWRDGSGYWSVRNKWSTESSEWTKHIYKDKLK